LQEVCLMVFPSLWKLKAMLGELKHCVNSTFVPVSSLFWHYVDICRLYKGIVPLWGRQIPCKCIFPVPLISFCLFDICGM
jgi:hypothetical protein